MAGLFLLGALIIGLMLTNPAYQALQAAQKDVVNRQAEFDAETALVNEVHNLESQYKGAQGDVQSALDILPQFNKESVPDLLSELEEIASQSSLFLDTIAFTTASEQKAGTQTNAATSPTQTIKVQFGVQGGYANIKYFIYLIESDRHLMDLSTLTLAPITAQSSSATAGSESTATNNSIVLTGTLNAYYQ